MKKLFAILLVFVSLFVLVACGGEEEPVVEPENKVMTYGDFMKAEDKSEVTVETFIQAKQSWWEKDGVGLSSFYTMDRDGAYFLYNMPCSEDDYNNKLKVGAKIRVKGTKALWSGELEITDATWELLEGTYLATPKELTKELFNTKASDYQNQLFSLAGLEVLEFDGDGAAFGYKYNGSGERGDDIYFKVKVGETVHTFTVESTLCDKDSDTYKAAEALEVGDTIAVEGFMYWYNTTPQPHITKITKSAPEAMSYNEFAAAELKSEVVVETYIQAKQSWWEKDGVGVGTFYTMDEDGGYFLYNMPCSKDDYDNKLVIGAKIRVTGTKSAWSDEVEITDATWELLEGTYVASPTALTADEYNTNAIAYQNQLFALAGLEVLPFDEEGAAFGYKYNGSGERGDDIYFNLSVGGTKKTFVVESYLCDKDSDTYKAVEALQVGDVISVEAFMYWYNGAQPHVTKVSDIFEKSEGVMTYDEFDEAELKSQVVVETFIQAKQSWWENDGVGVGTFYTMDADGGYFLYNMPCSKDDYDNKLVIGAKIRVTGTKSAWSGEVEITDATWELLDGTFVFTPIELLADDFNTDAIYYQNQLFSLEDLEVIAFDEEGAAFGYKYNGSGERGDDIYFKVMVGETQATLVIESYLCDKDSDTYKAAEALKVGDHIDIEGFMYWYNGAQPHVIKITVNE